MCSTLRKLCVWISLCAIVSGGTARTQEISVFAAASLGEVLTEIGDKWPDKVTLSLAGSGAIARQVARGAPADVVILANTVWMDWLETRGLLRPRSRSNPFGNALTVIGAKGSAPLPSIDTETVKLRLGADGRLAMGDHRAVPAGQYAKIWLGTVRLWENVSERLAETDNVRAALALVARGEVPIGIVYRTDLQLTDKVEEIWPIPPHEQPEIRYAVAAITEKGRAFAAALSGADARAILRRQGFLIPGEN